MRSRSDARMVEIKHTAEQFYMKHFRTPSTSEIAQEIGMVKSTVHRYLVEMNARGMLSYRNGILETEKMNKVCTERTCVPVLGSVPCGLPQEEEECVEEYVSLPVSMFGKGDFFILRAKGCSMINAGINPGDLVVIKKQEMAQNGDIVVALGEEGNTLKRFYRDDKNRRVILHPENDEMDDIYMDQCQIQGVAVKVIKDLT